MANQSKTTLPNDFERMVPEYHKGLSAYGEHVARYEVIGAVLRGKTVLDIASGSGYGTAILAKEAAHVYGVDVFAPAVAYATENYGAKNITYLVGDGVKIPLDDAVVDVVVSLETIEHIEDYEQFMREVKRVLKPDGLLILSTPNDKEFIEDNHHHIHEFEHDELAGLVKKYFTEMKPYYQATWVCNIVGEQRLLTTEWREPITFMQACPLELDQALYFFFLCANRPITEELTTLGCISEHHSDRLLQQKRNMTDKHVSNLQEIIDADKAYVDDLGTQFKQLQTELSSALERSQKLERELHRIKSSRLWRYGQHVRKVQRIIKR